MIGFALLGCGGIGRMHARIITAHPRTGLDRFIGCVEHGAAQLAGFAEGHGALHLADAALESLKTDWAVRVVSAEGAAVQEAAA